MSTPETRRTALWIILDARARQRERDSDEVRLFTYPKEKWINFDASYIMDLLYWDKLPEKYITPPPILEDYTDDQLIESVESNKLLDMPKLLGHSQRNEE